MKYTLAQLVQFKQAMLQVIDYRGRKFSYALERNLTKVDACEKKARKSTYSHPAFKENELFTKYINAKRAMEFKHAKKDENGAPVYDQDDNLVLIDEEAFDKEAKELQEAHPVGVEIWKERSELVNAEWQTEFEVDFYTILSEDDLPDEITTADRVRLRFMFSDNLVVKEEVENE